MKPETMHAAIEAMRKAEKEAGQFLTLDTTKDAAGAEGWVIRESKDPRFSADEPIVLWQAKANAHGLERPGITRGQAEDKLDELRRVRVITAIAPILTA